MFGSSAAWETLWLQDRKSKKLETFQILYATNGACAELGWMDGWLDGGNFVMARYDGLGRGGDEGTKSKGLAQWQE